ncbi:MAG: hypothetical protein AAGD07_17415, partial [Planctomycetota bacterium]
PSDAAKLPGVQRIGASQPPAHVEPAGHAMQARVLLHVVATGHDTRCLDNSCQSIREQPKKAAGNRFPLQSRLTMGFSVTNFIPLDGVGVPGFRDACESDRRAARSLSRSRAGVNFITMQPQYLGTYLCLFGLGLVLFSLPRVHAQVADQPARMDNAENSGQDSEPPPISIPFRPHRSSIEVEAYYQTLARSRADERDVGRGTQPAANERPNDVQTWIGQLGSAEFAQRESATSSLYQLGLSALPALRAAAKRHADAEVRMRAAALVSSLDAEQRDDHDTAFLMGGETPLEGWPVVQALIGDNLRVRELFLAMYREHPALIHSLIGTPDDRISAARLTTTQLNQAMMRALRAPSTTDLMALLLVAADPNVKLPPIDERIIMRIVGNAVGTSLLSDPHMSGPARSLLVAWMNHSQQGNREEMLWLTTQLSLAEGVGLAVKTIDELSKVPNPDMATLRMAMQALSRFGHLEDAKRLVPLMDDERLAQPALMAGPGARTTLVGDLACTTIALLLRQPLSTIGLPDGASHPIAGFDPSQIGFPSTKPELRLQCRKNTRESLIKLGLGDWLSGTPKEASGKLGESSEAQDSRPGEIP